MDLALRESPIHQGLQGLHHVAAAPTPPREDVAEVKAVAVNSRVDHADRVIVRLQSDYPCGSEGTVTLCDDVREEAPERFHLVIWLPA